MDAANNRAQSEMWAEALVDHSSFISVTKTPNTIPVMFLFLEHDARHADVSSMSPDRMCLDMSVVSIWQLIGP